MAKAKHIKKTYKSPESEIILQRLMSNCILNMSSGCMEWTLAKRPDGYARMIAGGKLMYIHRLSWILQKGEIHNGLLVCHKCDNRLCINIDHLFLGTHSENTIDKVRKGRDHNASRTECYRGHKYTEESLYKDKFSNRRHCRICRNEAYLKSKY